MYCECVCIRSINVWCVCFLILVSVVSSPTGGVNSLDFTIHTHTHTTTTTTTTTTTNTVHTTTLTGGAAIAPGRKVTQRHAVILLNLPEITKRIAVVAYRLG
eukprot:GDKK01037854.1.p2 GENE.GDKK01037854.1~~GDKK01037854.1.p2  ORF type:complete len:102 (-),score=3.11 GDKK01037854.1:154-459(-)